MGRAIEGLTLTPERSVVTVHLPIIDSLDDPDCDPAVSWRSVGVRVFGVGAFILTAFFGAYEIVERTLLEGAPGQLIHRLHIARGVGAALLLAGWSLRTTLEARRHADREFARRAARLRAEIDRRTRALAQSQAFTESLFDSLRDRVIVTDASGRVVKSNAAARAAAGCPVEGRVCAEVFPECASRCTSRVAGVQRAPSPRPLVVRDPRSGRVWSIESYPMRFGAPGLVLEVARDVTEEKRLEALVRHQEKMASLGVLAAGIAHDIGNPLASISSELEMLDGEEDLSRIRESLEVLRAHVDRIARILREIVDFARRRDEDGSGCVDVGAAVRDALRLLRHDRRTREVTIVEKIADGLPCVNLSEDHLLLVVVNLLLNALDATAGGGTVVVEAATTEDGCVRIRVSDDGHGMDPEVLERATEPLFTTKGDRGGTGLGLSVSQSTIREAGGDLELRSTPGRGTDVTFTLPAVTTVQR